MKGKRWLAALMMIGVVGVAAVSAQSGSAPEEPDTSASTWGIPARGLLRNGERILLQSAADATGMEPRDLVPLLREGLTLAEIVESSGGDVEAVIADAVADATARITEAVANGNMTQERADELIIHLERLFTQVVNQTVRQNRAEAVVGMGVLRLAAEETGLLPREIAAELRGGSTLGEVLTEHGVDVSAFIDDVVAQTNTRLDQAVSNGHMTQERADEMLNNLRERLTERLNSTNPL
jgi:hypothetical protein